MSRQLISRSHDLSHLREEGYDIEIRAGYLLVKDVPYVNSEKQVRRGMLVSSLTTAGERTAPPGDHVVWFVGECPCDARGVKLSQIIINENEQRLADGLTAQYQFSSKPVGTGVYPDYYSKMTTYAAILTSQAQAVKPDATARTFPVVTATEEESVFEYIDTASSRAGIVMASRKLELGRVAIVGVGGTGSYVLDLVAKTPVKEIHLFDGDELLSHNAFRAPGAASVTELTARPRKVDYWKGVYSKMRRGIHARSYYVVAENVAELQGMDFVFLCIDGGEAKRSIAGALEAAGVAFVDVGMGVELVDDSLRGVIRVTASTPSKRDHFAARAPMAPVGLNDEYDTNIQVCDLNALNAALAVIKWKKLCGFYLDFEREHHSDYAISSNALVSEESS